MWSRPVAPEIPAGRRGDTPRLIRGRRLRRKGRCADNVRNWLGCVADEGWAEEEGYVAGEDRRDGCGKRCHRPSGVLNDERPRSRLGSVFIVDCDVDFGAAGVGRATGAGPDAAAIPTAFRTTRSPAASTSLPSVCFRSRMRASVQSLLEEFRLLSHSLCEEFVFTHCCRCSRLRGNPPRPGGLSPGHRGGGGFTLPLRLRLFRPTPLPPFFFFAGAGADAGCRFLVPLSPADGQHVGVADEPCESNTNARLETRSIANVVTVSTTNNTASHGITTSIQAA